MRTSMIILLIVSELLVSAMPAGAEETVSGEISDSSAVTMRTDEESIAGGKIIFEKVCIKCHDPHSTAFRVGPGLKGILKADRLPVSGKPATAENILKQLNSPINKMPAFFFMSVDSKLNVIAYLNTL